MSKITIVGPCQNIQRELHPPHAKHLITHQFIGGTRVIAQVLSELFSDSKLTNDWAIDISVDPNLPTRRLRLEPYAAAPALKEELKPKTQFLRIAEAFEPKDPYAVIPDPFFVTGGSISKQFLVLSGAEDSAKGDESAAIVKSIEHLNTELDYVYVISKSKDELTNYKNIIHKILGADKPKTKIIGQIDVDKLERNCSIQTKTAYERTIGDICRNLFLSIKTDKDKKDPNLLIGGYTGYDALIIRIGNAACAIIFADREEKKDPIVKLFCHPERCAPTELPGLGSMQAYDILFCASIIHALEAPMVGCLTKDEANLMYWEKSICDGAKVGVHSTYRCFVEGFGIYNQKSDHETMTKMVVKNPGVLLAKFIERGISAESSKSEETAAKYSLEYPKLKSIDSPMPVWEENPKSILTHDVDFVAAHSPNQFWRMVVPEPEGDNFQNCLPIAQNYLTGVTKHLPLVKIGINEIVDRLEVEDYLYLQRLLLAYERDPKWTRPLCIGVFGQPGSGKSFGVTELINEMSSDVPIFSKEKITVNLSQTMSMEELIETFHRVRDECLKEPIPLVFFDEFDSTFEGKSFGWLKYFLAPMQDGNFTFKNKTYSFGKAVFVFAGGVNHSFSEFNERSRNPEFCDAKGPDFISRLRGTLNIRGMNIPEENEERASYVNMIKRAVFLKFLLKKKIGKDFEGKLIEPLLADAFLQIPAFKHGARSLEAILEMSSINKGETFHLSQLPPRDQLDMHVNARAFLQIAKVSSTLSNDR